MSIVTDYSGRTDRILRILERFEFRRAHPHECSAILEGRARVFEGELGFHGVDAFDQEAIHLVAVEPSSGIVGAFRIMVRAAGSLEVERYTDLSSVAPVGHQLAQIGGLWIREDYRGFSKQTALVLGMLKLSIKFAQAHEIADFVMYTYARLVPFYLRAFFGRTGIAFDHPKWGIVHVLHLNVGETLSNKTRSPLGDFLRAEHTPNFII